MALRFCLTVLLFAFTLMAHAEEPRLGQSWLALVQALEDKGIHQIGDFDLETFKNQALQIQWQEITPDQISEIAEGRGSAYYLIRDQKVFISTELPKDGDPGALELHEALGATGYNDKAYNLSSSLVNLSQMSKGSAQVKLTRNLGVTVFTKKQLLGSGSGTSVGGGGDLIALSAKNQFLQRLLLDPKWQNAETLAFLTKVNFEPFYDPNQQFLALRYLTNSAKNFLPTAPKEIPGVLTNLASGYQDQITFYIPALIWEQDPSQRNALIERAVTTAQYLIPVIAKDFPGKIETYACGSQKFTFLKKSDDEYFQLIQKSRIAVMSGCGLSSLITEVRIPSFVDFDGNFGTTRKLPVDEQARFTKGLCTFEAKGRVLTQLETLLKKGQGAWVEFSVGLNNEASLIGFAFVNEQGQIRGLRILKHGGQAGVLADKGFELKSPSNSARMTIEALPGLKIDLHCETGPAGNQ